MLRKVFVSCVLLVSVFKIAHSVVDCNTSARKCDSIIRLDVMRFFYKLAHSHVTPDELSATCSSWINCTIFMQSVGCTWDNLRQAYLDNGGVLDWSNSFVYPWYYSNMQTEAKSMDFVCDNATQGYISYYQCYNRNNYSDALSRCEATLQAKHNVPFDPQYHYCDYGREAATCFYKTTNGTCSLKVASYFASIWFKTRHVWRGQEICDYNVTDLLINSRQDVNRSCDVDGFFFCSSKMPHLINAEWVFYCMSQYGEQLDCDRWSRFDIHWAISTTTAVCSDWNSFLGCSARTGCSVRSSDIQDVTWSIGKDFWAREPCMMSVEKQLLFNSFDMFNYTCGEGRGLLRNVCRSDSRAEMCYSVTRTKLSEPFFKMFGLCRAIFENAVCVYGAAVKQGCNETSIAATVELRTKYFEFFNRIMYWNWPTNWPPCAPVTTAQCGVDFGAVKNASYAVYGNRCRDTEFVECLVQSNMFEELYRSRYYVNHLEQLLNGLLRETWFSTKCKPWEAFHKCWQCNNTDIVYKQVDFVAAHIEANGYNTSGNTIDDFQHAKFGLNYAMTPRRMDMLCLANVSANVTGYLEHLEYEKCLFESGGFYDNFSSCILGSYTPNELCRFCKRCFRQLYAMIVTRCPVKVGIFVLEYLMTEWTPYLQNKNCILNVSDIVPQCNESSCAASLGSTVANYTQLLTNGQLTSTQLTTACWFATYTSSCIIDDIRIRCNVEDVYRVLVDDVTPYLCANSKQQAYLTNQACYDAHLTATSSSVKQFFSGVNCSTVRSSFFNLYTTLNESCGRSAAEAVTGLAAQFRIIASLPPSNTTWCPNVIHPFKSTIPLFKGPFYKTIASSCIDFYFTCRVNYTHLSTDDGARFDVSLTFDGQLTTSYRTTNATQLEVIFTQDDIRGHLGTMVSCAVCSYWVQLPYSKSKFVFSENSYFWNAAQCPCEADRCWNGATCVWNETLKDHSCICLPGFTDTDCSIDIDDCADFPCEPFGECVDLVNDYSCSCRPGFLPTTSSKFCSDIDECITADGQSPCLNNGSCHDDIDRFICVCPVHDGRDSAFVGPRCGIPLPTITILQPTVKGIQPTKGTVSGGALVTITGDRMDFYPAINAAFRNDDCPTIYGYVSNYHSSPNAVVIITPMANSSYIGKQLQVRVEFAGPVTQNVPLFFTYCDNPVIEDIQPRVQFANGGIQLTVYGKYLDVVSDPKMTVTVETYSTSDASTVMTTYISVCGSNSSSTMFCRMPVLHLDAFIGCNDTTRNGTAVATIRCDNITVNLYIGFQLENVPTYMNISKSNPHIYFTLITPNPQFERPSDHVVFDPATDEVLTIKGTGFSRGCSRHDYFIMIGSANCSLKVLTDNHITCSPPIEKPQLAASTFCGNQSEAFTLTTKIGSNIRNTFFVYCVIYAQSPSHVPLIIGLCVGLGGGLLILVVVLTVVLVCRQSRSSKTHATKPQSVDESDSVSVDRPASGNSEFNSLFEAARNDEYSKHVETTSGEGGDGVVDFPRTTSST